MASPELLVLRVFWQLAPDVTRVVLNASPADRTARWVAFGRAAMACRGLRYASEESPWLHERKQSFARYHMSSSNKLRLKKEERDMAKQLDAQQGGPGAAGPMLLPNVLVGEGYYLLRVGEDYTAWQAAVLGPENHPMQGGIFLMDISLDDYPYAPPCVRLRTPCYHPDISPNGVIALDILGENWSPALTLRTLLISIRSLIADPNLECAVMTQSGNTWEHDRPAYNRNAAEWTSNFAGCECKMCAAVDMRHAAMICVRLLQLGRADADNSRIGNAISFMANSGDIGVLICSSLFPDDAWPLTKLHSHAAHRCRFSTAHYPLCRHNSVLSAGMFPRFVHPKPYVDRSLPGDPFYTEAEGAALPRHPSAPSQ